MDISRILYLNVQHKYFLNAQHKYFLNARSISTKIDHMLVDKAGLNLKGIYSFLDHSRVRMGHLRTLEASEESSTG